MLNLMRAGRLGTWYGKGKDYARGQSATTAGRRLSCGMTTNRLPEDCPRKEGRASFRSEGSARPSTKRHRALYLMRRRLYARGTCVLQFARGWSLERTASKRRNEWRADPRPVQNRHRFASLPDFPTAE